MNQHYEWKKATPDNLPKEYKNYHVRRRGFTGNIYEDTAICKKGKWDYDCKEGDPVVEYLAEVEQTWPTDEQIKEAYKTEYQPTEFHPEHSWVQAINWLKQQVGNKEFNHFPFGVTPKDTSNDPNLTGNNKINQM